MRSRSLLLIAAILVAGCGTGDGLTHYPVQGTVTYDGQPVRFGAIFFEPTASVGQMAPTVYLPVRDGKYDAGDKGPVAGTYRVVVGGMDTAREHVDDDGVTHTPPLFPDYTFEVEIPPPDNRLDVVVPTEPRS